MWYYIDVFFKSLPGLMLVAFIITGIWLIICRRKILHEKRLNKEFIECIECKDAVLEEFKKIRHEYNNILQTLTFFIEEEDMDGLTEYKSKLMEKTHLLNKNNLAQLAKIKDKSMLRMVYKLFMNAKEARITLNLTIYNDIGKKSVYKTEFYDVLQAYLEHAYKSAVKEATEIHLKISETDKGLRFCFENFWIIKPEHNTPILAKSMRNIKTDKNIFFNTFLQEALLMQEIMIPFNS